MCHSDTIQMTTVFFIIIYTPVCRITVSKFFHDGFVSCIIVHSTFIKGNQLVGKSGEATYLSRPRSFSSWVEVKQIGRFQ